MAGPFYFAWAGATIQPQTVLITAGTTHGGLLQQMSIVGDIGSTAGPQQLVNLASYQDLEVGTLYMISGPGIAAGTFFLYDDSVLAGASGSINLSAPASGSLVSATFQVTKSAPIGDIVGTITQGSNIVDLGGVDLLPGVYSISGTGIGETLVPVGTVTSLLPGYTVPPPPAPMTVPSAYFTYSGSGSATLYMLVAQPHIVDTIDQFGIGIERISYTVYPQEVTATTTGSFPMVIYGMPDADWHSVTAIPGMALSSLNAGSRYNISGNGIQTGSTFVAPAPGATSIELDLPASAANFNTILTITGPRTPDADFDPAIHAREDEQVIGFEIAQDEGNFATLTLDIRNPGTGLLAAGRQSWCWLSWDNGTDIVPLFNGRLIGVPKLEAGEVTQLQFIARPDDFNAQKESQNELLAVLPFYDPVWLATNINPDTVLESYSALWYVDRVTLALTTSDIIQGEDGTVTIQEDQALYDNFSLSYGEPPITSLVVSGTVGWQQQADGWVEVTDKITKAFQETGSPFNTFPPSGATFGWITFHGPEQPIPSSGGALVSCLCGNGLKSDWPKQGTSIGGGWSLSTRVDETGVPSNYIVDATAPNEGGWMLPQSYYVTYDAQTAPPTQAGLTQEESNVNIYLQPYGTFTIGFPVNVYKIRMTLEYRADRKRTETVSFVLTSDVQTILSDTAEQDREEMNFTSEYVGTAIDFGGTIPIGNLGARSYFQTDRGTASLQYMMLAARAKLRARARAVDINFATTFDTGLGIGLRNSVTLFDRRIAGGSATGKVKQYKLSVGENGMLGEFTMGCCIGNGNAATAAAGTKSYVEDEYVDPGYQVIDGGQVFLVADELAYQPLDEFAVVDDGLNFASGMLSADQAVNFCTVRNGLTKQIPAMAAYQQAAWPFPGDPIGEILTLQTTVTIDLKPVQGSEYHTNFFPAVSLLALPKQIDLAATSPVEDSGWDISAGIPQSPWDSGASVWDYT